MSFLDVMTPDGQTALRFPSEMTDAEIRSALRLYNPQDLPPAVMASGMKVATKPDAPDNVYQFPADMPDVEIKAKLGGDIEFANFTPDQAEQSILKARKFDLESGPDQPFDVQLAAFAGSVMRGIGTTATAVVDPLVALAERFSPAGVGWRLFNYAKTGQFFGADAGWNEPVQTLQRAIIDRTEVDPKLQDSFLLGDIPNAFGSSLTFLIGGLPAAGLKASSFLARAAAPAVMGAMAGWTEGYNRAKAHGATESRAMISGMINAGLGLTEALPAERWIKNLTGRFNAGPLRKQIIPGAAEEGLQELTQAVGGDLTAKALTGEELNEEDWAKATGAGGTVGAVFATVTSMIGRHRRAIIRKDFEKRVDQARLQGATEDQVQNARDEFEAKMAAAESGEDPQTPPGDGSGAPGGAGSPPGVSPPPPTPQTPATEAALEQLRALGSVRRAFEGGPELPPEIGDNRKVNFTAEERAVLSHMVELVGFQKNLTEALNNQTVGQIKERITKASKDFFSLTEEEKIGQRGQDLRDQVRILDTILGMRNAKYGGQLGVDLTPEQRAVQELDQSVYPFRTHGEFQAFIGQVPSIQDPKLAGQEMNTAQAHYAALEAIRRLKVKEASGKMSDNELKALSFLEHQLSFSHIHGSQAAANNIANLLGAKYNPDGKGAGLPSVPPIWTDADVGKLQSLFGVSKSDIGRSQMMTAEFAESEMVSLRGLLLQLDSQGASPEITNKIQGAIGFWSSVSKRRRDPNAQIQAMPPAAAPAAGEPAGEPGEAPAEGEVPLEQMTDAEAIGITEELSEILYKEAMNLGLTREEQQTLDEYYAEQENQEPEQRMEAMRKTDEHIIAVEKAVVAGRPVSAEAMRRYNMRVPEGWTVQGKLLVPPVRDPAMDPVINARDRLKDIELGLELGHGGYDPTMISQGNEFRRELKSFAAAHGEPVWNYSNPENRTAGELTLIPWPDGKFGYTYELKIGTGIRERLEAKAIFDTRDQAIDNAQSEMVGAIEEDIGQGFSNRQNAALAGLLQSLKNLDPVSAQTSRNDVTGLRDKFLALEAKLRELGEQQRQPGAPINLVGEQTKVMNELGDLESVIRRRMMMEGTKVKASTPTGRWGNSEDFRIFAYQWPDGQWSAAFSAKTATGKKKSARHQNNAIIGPFETAEEALFALYNRASDAIEEIDRSSKSKSVQETVRRLRNDILQFLKSKEVSEGEKEVQGQEAGEGGKALGSEPAGAPGEGGPEGTRASQATPESGRFSPIPGAAIDPNRLDEAIAAIEAERGEGAAGNFWLIRDSYRRLAKEKGSFRLSLERDIHYMEELIQRQTPDLFAKYQLTEKPEAAVEPGREGILADPDAEAGNKIEINDIFTRAMKAAPPPHMSLAELRKRPSQEIVKDSKNLAQMHGIGLGPIGSMYWALGADLLQASEAELAERLTDWADFTYAAKVKQLELRKKIQASREGMEANLAEGNAQDFVVQALNEAWLYLGRYGNQWGLTEGMFRKVRTVAGYVAAESKRLEAEAVPAEPGEKAPGQMTPDEAVQAGIDRGDYYRAVTEAFRQGEITEREYQERSENDPEKWPTVQVGDDVYVPQWHQAGRVVGVGYGWAEVQHPDGKSYRQSPNLETLKEWNSRHDKKLDPLPAAEPAVGAKPAKPAKKPLHPNIPAPPPAVPPPVREWGLVENIMDQFPQGIRPKSEARDVAPYGADAYGILMKTPLIRRGGMGPDDVLEGLHRMGLASRINSDAELMDLLAEDWENYQTWKKKKAPEQLNWIWEQASLQNAGKKLGQFARQGFPIEALQVDDVFSIKGDPARVSKINEAGEVFIETNGYGTQRLPPAGEFYPDFKSLLLGKRKNPESMGSSQDKKRRAKTQWDMLLAPGSESPSGIIPGGDPFDMAQDKANLETTLRAEVYNDQNLKEEIDFLREEVYQPHTLPYRDKLKSRIQSLELEQKRRQAGRHAYIEALKRDPMWVRLARLSAEDKATPEQIRLKQAIEQSNMGFYGSGSDSDTMSAEGQVVGDDSFQASTEAQAEDAARDQAAQDYAERSQSSTERDPTTAETPNFARLAGKGFRDGSMVNPVFIPELLKLYYALTKKYPKLRRLRSQRGAFYQGSMRITIHPDLGFNPLAIAKTLAHEIGHLIDYLPDKDMLRGNLLGRIASLRNHIETMMAGFPGGPGPLNEADRKRIEKEARAAVPWREREIDEEIERRYGVKPEDIIAIWNSTDQSKLNPALLSYVKGLSTAEKKSIIKEAMKGMVPAQLNHLMTVVKEKTGRKIKVKVSDEQRTAEIKAEFQKRWEQEIKDRHLLTEEIIRKEIVDLSNAWRPWDPNTASESHRKYRASAVELYADALSVFLNSPGMLEREAPMFYRGLMNYMNQKPEVLEAYMMVQDILSGTPDELLEKRRADVKEWFSKGEDLIRKREQERRTAGLSTTEFTLQLFYDKSMPYAKYEEGKDLSLDESARNTLEELSYWRNHLHQSLSKIDSDVVGPVIQEGMTMEDIGEFLLYRRIATETNPLISDFVQELSQGGRQTFINPGGIVSADADARLAAMKQEFGDHKFEVLKEAVRKFDRIIFSEVERSVAYGVYNSTVAADKILPSEGQYATFAVLDYIQGEYVTPYLKSQVGTFSPVASPFTATLLKHIQLIRVNELNRAKRRVIERMEAVAPGTIVKRKTWPGMPASKSPKPSHGNEIIVVLENGRPVFYEMPSALAAAFQSHDVGRLAVAGTWFQSKTYAIFHPLFVSWNPAFTVRNLQRDFRRLYTGITAAQKFGGEAPSFLDVFKAWYEAWPIAWKRANKINEPLIEQMLKERALDIPFTLMQESENDTVYDRQLRQAGIVTPHKSKNPALRALLWLVDRVEAINIASETVPKVAAFRLLQRQGNVSLAERAFIVRNHVGTPNIRRKGLATDLSNGLLMYSKVFMNGITSDLALVAEPKTRWEFLLRSFFADILPKMTMRAATLGAFGAAVKAWFDLIPDYDKTNYLIFPFGTKVQEDGQVKAVYLRLPHAETGRLIGGLTWLVSKGMKPKEVMDAIAFGVSQAPGLSPYIDIAQKWLAFSMGVNPYDTFFRSNVVSEDEWKAGLDYSFPAMVRWTINQTGVAASVYKTVFPGRWTEQRTWLEKTASMPGINALLKVSDSGIREGEWEVIELEDQEGARFRLGLPPIVKRFNSERYRLNRLGPEYLEGPKLDRYYELNSAYSGYRAMTQAIRTLEANGESAEADVLRKELGEFIEALYAR